ncbi:MAG TPA: hypothetical protein PKA82_06360 [Pyrinomonadaceae bacterium]|nr:hypothetical protein [Pyrinomonadaceae bacterium]
MKYLISATLIVAGIIHILPLVGVLGSERLTALYGIPFDEPNLAILMRHRAVLLGLFGALFVVAAFFRTLQPTAFMTGLITVVSFLLLTWLTGNYNEQIGRVFIADLVALICLIVGGAAYIYTEIGQA